MYSEFMIIRKSIDNNTDIKLIIIFLIFQYKILIVYF